MQSKLNAALMIAEVLASIAAFVVVFWRFDVAIVLLALAGAFSNVSNAIRIGNLGVRVAEGLGDLDVRVTTLETGGFDLVKKS